MTIKRWLSKPWNWINPYANGMAAHPLLWIEAKHAPEWAQSPEQLSRKTLNLFGIGALISMGVLFVLALFLGFTKIGTMLLFVAAVILLLGVIVDYQALSVAIGSINTDFITGRWDALRITSLNEKGIIYAKHAATQLRVWRITSIIVGLRLGIAPVMLFYTMMSYTNASDISAISLDMIVFLVVFGVVAAVVSLLLVLEPFWRLKAVTALVMSVSATVHNLPLANMVAWVFMIGFWLIQLTTLMVVLFVIAIPISFIGTLIFVESQNLFISLLAITVVTLTALTTAIIVLNGMYDIVKEWSLLRVISRLQK